ncbi:MAG: 50S ribosomal protein L21e [Candidatus Nanohaloarchaea archaeon]|nr:50S ribosomal protein L21e [Candidatus Nanohaloarchaea archaeon]
MAKKSQGTRNKTRRKMSKSARDRTGLSNYFQEFNPGDNAVIDIDPAVHEGLPHPRFHGRTAEVREKRGGSYIVELKDNGSKKSFAAHPAHLKPAEEN